MADKKELIFLVFFLGIFLIGIASAAVYCCEKTTSNAYCQNVDIESECSTEDNPLTGDSYRSIASSCDSTSFCSDGTCIIQQEGRCMSNTPQVVCQQTDGAFWSPEPKEELAQCQLGCCLIGSQAAFVTQTACKAMSTTYGINTSFRANIKDELTCLASANPGTEGACVYVKDFITTCERTTRSVCNNKGKSSALSDVEFHAGFLCSAEELATNCAPKSETKCSNNDVYFVDSCGNLGNIYDASKAPDNSNKDSDYKTYWERIQAPAEGDGGGNKNSAVYGDCDYLFGSRCGAKETGDNPSGGTLYGDNFCKSLDCEDWNGDYYPGGGNENGNPRHGESWCETDSESGSELSPGASYYKVLCMNGEITKTRCDPSRQKICANGIIDENNDGTLDSDEDFYVGSCKANVWQDCIQQENQEDCENRDVRDCVWKGYPNGWTPKLEGEFDFSDELADFAPILRNSDGENKGGACVPLYAPGFDRTSSSSTIAACTAATTSCYVVIGDPLIGEEHVKENEACTKDAWLTGMLDICTSLGDCDGSKVNYKGRSGDTGNPLGIKKV